MHLPKRSLLLSLSLAAFAYFLPPETRGEDSVSVGDSSSSATELELSPIHIAYLAQQASQLLAAEHVDTQSGEQALHQQQAIIETLHRMLRSPGSSLATMPAASTSRGASGTSPSGAATGTATSNHADPHTGSGGESSGLPAMAEPESVSLTRRDGLMTAVWGHLPPKVRDELYRSYSERFVPQYDELLRRYYATLAESPSSR